jgi:hypothetical protein
MESVFMLILVESEKDIKELRKKVEELEKRGPHFDALLRKAK